jgi:hypothetical protein
MGGGHRRAKATAAVTLQDSTTKLYWKARKKTCMPSHTTAVFPGLVGTAHHNVIKDQGVDTMFINQGLKACRQKFVGPNGRKAPCMTTKGCSKTIE